MESVLGPKLHFDHEKPFYHIVLAYLAQLHGIVELISRGVKYKYGDRFKNADIQELINPADGTEAMLPNDAARLVKLVSGGLTELLGQPAPASVLLEAVKINTEKLAVEVLGYNDVKDMDILFRCFQRMSSGALLINAWAVTERFSRGHELWQFLKHCRNAAAHDGKFSFKPGEPRKTAKWRTIEIKHSLQGKLLFDGPVKNGFIGPGDVLYLLSDIEKTLLP